VINVVLQKATTWRRSISPKMTDKPYDIRFIETCRSTTRGLKRYIPVAEIG
jgi:hypothetical protein